jgi:DNA repair protein RadA/Sms
VRPVPQAAARLKEAAKLGFGRAIVPDSARAEGSDNISLTTVGALAGLVADIVARGSGTNRTEKRVVGSDG